MQDVHEIYMQRCLELALLGAGKVAPNPMVGAVLVYHDRIIGEGYHQQYGGPHAEVNCLDSVTDDDRLLVHDAVLYVSLEPCAHFGKTPPCADLIIRHEIKKVVIGCRDPFTEVNGKGIEKLRSAGVEVITGILEKECIALNRRFFTFHTKHRPYIILKWAQTANNKIAGEPGQRLLISNEHTNRLVHQWRSEEAAILVGTNTALLDDPSLTNRLWTGKNPVRMVIDMSLRLPATLKLFDQQQKTIVFNTSKQETNNNILYHQVKKEETILPQILNAAHKLQLQSILVEGGAKLLQSFIDAGLWDEARVIKNEQLTINNGLNAPILNDSYDRKEKIITDTIYYYTNKPTNE
jgi:diaminohydroxyphosphoribosylaminopyrimidine deaminase/5-amino-6-(5-phosphoribosylamino)uracil reductase